MLAVHAKPSAHRPRSRQGVLSTPLTTDLDLRLPGDLFGGKQAKAGAYLVERGLCVALLHQIPHYARYPAEPRANIQASCDSALVGNQQFRLVQPPGFTLLVPMIRFGAAPRHHLGRSDKVCFATSSLAVDIDLIIKTFLHVQIIHG
jgi:hypothetical protein